MDTAGVAVVFWMTMTGIGKSIGVSKSVYSELVSKASCFVRHFSFRVADAAEQKTNQSLAATPGRAPVT